MQGSTSKYTGREYPDTPPDIERALLEVSQEVRARSHAESDEIDKYQLLRDQARAAGQLALAQQLDSYASQLRDEWMKNNAARAAEQAWHAVQTLSRVDQGWARVFVGLDDEADDQRALHEIRRMLLAHDDDAYVLGNAACSQSEFASSTRVVTQQTNYTMPMQGGMQYVEIHERSLHTDGRRMDTPEILMVEIHKRITPEAQG